MKGASKAMSVNQNATKKKPRNLAAIPPHLTIPVQSSSAATPARISASLADVLLSCHHRATACKAAPNTSTRGARLMTFRSRIYFLSLTLILLAASPAAAQVGNVPSPRDVVGFEPGEDRKLADWSQIIDYFKRLDKASARVSVHQLGVSTERRPFIVAIISSEKNIENLPRIRQSQASLPTRA